MFFRDSASRGIIASTGVASNSSSGAYQQVIRSEKWEGQSKEMGEGGESREEDAKQKASELKLMVEV